MNLSKMLVFFYFIICSSCSSDKITASSVDIYSREKSNIKAYNLVTPEVAYKLISDNPEKFIPIQVSKKEAYLQEHIPLANNLWRPDYGSEKSIPFGGLIASSERIQSLLQKLGYENGKTLLLYDIKANVDALRLAWVLNLYGFDDFKIINGGLTYWKSLSLPTTKAVSTTPLVSKYRFSGKTPFDTASYANFKEVLSAIKDTNTLLIDTREDYEFVGKPFLSNGKLLPYKKGAFDRGSIPSALHLNWSTFADLNGDHRIKSESDLRYDLHKKGITPEKNIILYCHSGSRTSHTFYVLKHVLGYPNVKNYDGSWIEWSYMCSKDSSIPIQYLCDEETFRLLSDSLATSLKKNKY